MIGQGKRIQFTRKVIWMRWAATLLGLLSILVASTRPLQAQGIPLPDPPEFSNFTAGDITANGASTVVTTPTEIPLYDFNHDGDFTDADLNLFGAHFGATGEDCGPYDLNGSGTVDISDFVIYASYYGAWQDWQNGGPEPTFYISEQDSILSVMATTETGPVTELYLPWSTDLPRSPDDQFAYVKLPSTYI